MRRFQNLNSVRTRNLISTKPGTPGVQVVHVGMSPPPTNQGLLALVVMLIVLGFIVAYCCWGACCRLLGRRGLGDSSSPFPDPPLGFSQPAIVLLPYGRMVLVDPDVLDQLSEADLLAIFDPNNDPRLRTSSPRLRGYDTATMSKENSETAFPPPSYDTLFGGPPPTYDETFLQQLQVITTTTTVTTPRVVLLPNRGPLSSSAPELATVQEARRSRIFRLLGRRCSVEAESVV